jgi:ectoine hydroxylase-related dioxygenase (phytanoyl-CoA dioxygenase family)
MKRATQANSARPPFLLRAVRREPHLYSAICKARLLYSRRVAGANMRELFRRHETLLAMNDFEREQVTALRAKGYALIPDFFSRAKMDRIFRAADGMFHNLEIDAQRAYSIQTRERRTLDGVSYEELAATEKTIALRDPLLRIPEALSVAFHEGILRIAANFLGYVPPLYRATIVRDFPHHRPLHSSNFHKDNDESDSLQIFIYLVDIDDTRGPLVYVPGSNHYDVRSCRPRLSRDLGLAANDGRLSDEEVERIYPRREWAVLRTGRGSVAVIHGNGIHKGPAWPATGGRKNLPRTAIKLDLHGYKAGISRDMKENRIRKSDFARMSELQRLFAHGTLVEENTLALAQTV